MISTRSEICSKVLIFLFYIVLWEIASIVLDEVLLLPSPFLVFRTFSVLIFELSFYHALFTTLSKILLGLLAGIGSGVLLSSLSSSIHLIRDLFSPLVKIIKSTPVASIVILLLVWIESRNLSFVISFLMVFPIIYENTLKGIDETDKNLLEMAECYRVKRRKKIRYIYVPYVLPYLESAISLSVGLSFKSGIAAEVISIPSGSIGERLYDAKVYLETPELFCWTFVIIILSFVLEKVLVSFSSAILRRISL